MDGNIVRTCPYCGNPYPTITIPGLRGKPDRHIQSQVCGCKASLEAKEAADRRRHQEELVKAWRATGVPARSFDVPPDFDGLRDMDFKGSLYLQGPKGSGKTTRACGILKAYVSEGQRGGWVSARFVSVPDWLASMRCNWGSDEENAYQVAAGCDFLVLDDLGKGKPTGWTMERIFRLVDTRYNNMRHTVFTSQYELPELGEHCSVNGDVETAEAMVSRLHEMCGIVTFGGDDHRM